jgi:hypothetical protein
MEPDGNIESGREVIDVDTEEPPHQETEVSAAATDPDGSGLQMKVDTSSAVLKADNAARLLPGGQPGSGSAETETAFVEGQFDSSDPTESPVVFGPVAKGTRGPPMANKAPSESDDGITDEVESAVPQKPDTSVHNISSDVTSSSKSPGNANSPLLTEEEEEADDEVVVVKGTRVAHL